LSLGTSANPGCGFAHNARRIDLCVAVMGRAFLRVPVCFKHPGIALLKRDRPSRLALPITALRLTPSSRAICPQDNPAPMRSFRSAMRSCVHVVSVIAGLDLGPKLRPQPTRAGCCAQPTAPPATAGNGSCRTKPSDPSGHPARDISLTGATLP